MKSTGNHCATGDQPQDQKTRAGPAPSKCREKASQKCSLPAARDCLKIDRCFRIVPEGLSYIENVPFYDRLDVCIRPNSFEQLFLGHQLTRMIQEIGQD
jgi:hypothetical protein